MFLYSGWKEGSRFYLSAFGKYVEVTEEIYYGYMKLVWKERKVKMREMRCNDGMKRCTGNCAECPYKPEGSPLSLDSLLEDDDFDVPDKSRRSVEDTVIMKLMIEEMYRQFYRLSADDQFIIGALFLFDEPMTQKQVGNVLGVSQQMVSKKLDKALSTLREAMKGWED